MQRARRRAAAPAALTVVGVLGGAKTLFEDEGMPRFTPPTATVESSSVDGLAVWVLRDRVGVQDGTREARLCIAADGTNRLISAVLPHQGKDTVAMDISEWEAVPPVKAPSASQIAKVPGS